MFRACLLSCTPNIITFCPVSIILTCSSWIMTELALASWCAKKIYCLSNLYSKFNAIHNWIFSILRFSDGSLVDVLKVLLLAINCTLIYNVSEATIGKVLASLPSQWVLNFISHWFKMFLCKSWSYEPFRLLVCTDCACILLFKSLEKISMLTVASFLHIVFRTTLEMPLA